MATIARHRTYPNVLLVTGTDVTEGNHLRNTINLLTAPTASPVTDGTHDFWIVYRVGSAVNPNAPGYERWGTTPRPRRMLVEMNSPPMGNPSATDVWTVLHEIGHLWGAPYDLGIRDPSVWPHPHPPTHLPREDESGRALAEDLPLPGPPMIGRAHCHWSPYWQADGSFMDGIGYHRTPLGGDRARWEQVTPTVPPIQPAGLPPLRMVSIFNDLDLWLMGIKSADEAYTSESGHGAGRIHWLTPRYIAPAQYRAGLCLVIGDNDTITFGFEGDHKTIGVTRTGLDPYRRVEVAGYDPFTDPNSAVALRIVRRGSTVEFQARRATVDASTLQSRHLAAASARSAPTIGESWIRVHSMTLPAPVGVGFQVTTWTPMLCDAAFWNLELAQGGRETVLITATRPEAWTYSPTSGYRALPPGRLVAYSPAPGPRMWTDRGGLRIAVTFADRWPDATWSGLPEYGQTGTVDRSPKVIARAPTGDFTIATTMRLERSAYGSNAGGAMMGRTMWGREQSAGMLDLVMPDRPRELRSTPPDGTYRTAFIITASDAADITDDMAEGVDGVRRYVSDAFPLVTQDLRRMATDI